MTVASLTVSAAFSIAAVPGAAPAGTVAGAASVTTVTPTVDATGLVSIMTGASSGEDGAAGLAPKPLAGQQNRALHGDGTWRQVAATNVSGLAAVATTGAYSDLSGRPSIPAAQVNSDWNAISGIAEILNKPTIRAISMGSFTLPPNVTSYTVTAAVSPAAADCTADSVVLLMPWEILHAANQIPMMPVTPGSGEFTVGCASNANTDAKFRFAIIN